MYQPLQKCLNYNPHFLLLQDILTTVANWLQLRSYICILLNVGVKLWIDNPETEGRDDRKEGGYSAGGCITSDLPGDSSLLTLIGMLIKTRMSHLVPCSLAPRAHKTTIIIHH